MKIGPPLKSEYTLIPPGVYEARIVSINMVDNNFFDAATDRPEKAKQLEWKLETTVDDEIVTLTAWTSTYTSTSARSKLAKFARAILGPSWVLDNGLDTDDLVGRRARVMVSNETKVKDGVETTYNKVVELLPSTAPSGTAIVAEPPF
ncbi:MAG: hypothetical protein P4L93_08210 [Coriobacteriia bacterium]|nr:hypothetical protein [Coriobacteriia bacterium]